jgi:hypothetical protein
MNNKNLLSFFYQFIKNSFVLAILYFAVGYCIVTLFEIFVFEKIPLLFSPQKTWIIFLSYILLWIIFCYIRALLSLRKEIKKTETLKVEGKIN